MAEKDEEQFYLERRGDRYRILNQQQKNESDFYGVLVMYMGIAAVAILFAFGFSPISFFLIIISTALIYIFRIIVVIIGGVIIVGAVLVVIGSILWWLFFT